MSMYRIKISSKGQVIIPAELRQELGLEKGTTASWRRENGSLVLTPMTKRLLGKIRGCLKPAPGEPTMFDMLFEERERERRREKR
jgi:AbrB family looped-hinge helix DNA binding protein